ncbi:cyclopropane-fatty-acyl-phospholipid synthase, partial [mine drainage metagenome]
MSSSDAAQGERGADGARSFEGRLLERMLTRLGNPEVEFTLWTGERIAPAGVEPVCRVRIGSRTTLLAIVADPAVRFPDAYCDGRVEIEGDLVRLLERVYLAGERARLPRPSAACSGGFAARTSIRSPARAPTSIIITTSATHSTNCGSARPWRIPAPITPPSETSLDQAQIAKMHHVCRKMRLRAGEHVVEAGCGWGALALHMARHYGVKVRAFNISKEQVAYARERAEREGLAGQVEYVQDDYRNICGRYDAFVSVGMLEH